MRVLFISYSYLPTKGGIEVSAHLLARGLVAHGVEVELVTLTTGQCDSEDRSYKVVRCPTVVDLWRMALRADVIYFHNPSLKLYFLLIAHCLFHRSRVITSIHTWLADPSGRVRIIDRLKKVLACLGPTICYSRAVQQTIGPDASVLPLPYDDTIFHRSAGEREPKAIVVGRLVSDKGVDVAVKAIDYLQQNGRSLSLIIVGDGPERIVLEKTVRDLQLMGYVTFLGSLDQESVARVAQSCRYWIVPSQWEEPFGIVALEAIACGCIPVVSRVGGYLRQ